MIIKFKKLDENARIPEKAHGSDFCYDCWAVSEKEVAPNVWMYGLGFALQIERDDILQSNKDRIIIDIEGRSRSSVWKTGMVLANSTATIDEGYTGEIKAVFYHVMPNMPRYKVGDKLLQITINATEPIDFVEVDSLDSTDREDGGFGSSGK